MEQFTNYELFQLLELVQGMCDFESELWSQIEVKLLRELQERAKPFIEGGNK